MGLRGHLPAWQAEGFEVVAAADPVPARLALEAVVGAYASVARQRTVRLPLNPDDAVYQRGLEALLEVEQAVAVTGF
jgi:hypothetical protein